MAQEIVTESTKRHRRGRLKQLEIAATDVRLPNEILGEGSFGTVYLADFNGLNSAVKIVIFESVYNGGRDKTERGDAHQSEISRSWGGVPGRGKDGKPPVVCGDNAATRTNPTTWQAASFMRELQAMKRLRSPHTVAIYGAITSHHDRLLLIMELLPGGDLRYKLKNARHPLDVRTVRSIARDVCSGLAYLHGQGILHGDLTSANVIFDLSGNAKVF